MSKRHLLYPYVGTDGTIRDVTPRTQGFFAWVDRIQKRVGSAYAKDHDELANRQMTYETQAKLANGVRELTRIWLDQNEGDLLSLAASEITIHFRAANASGSMDDPVTQLQIEATIGARQRARLVDEARPQIGSRT